MSKLTRADLNRTVATIDKALRQGCVPPEVQPRRGEHGVLPVAAKALGLALPSLRHRLAVAKQLGLEPDWSIYRARTVTVEAAVEDGLRQQLGAAENELRTVKAALAQAQGEEITREVIRKKILGLRDAPPDPPKWLVKPTVRGATGTPTLFLSDWHWAEVVRPEEVDGANAFDLQIAHRRVRVLVGKVVDLLFRCMAQPKYDGLVICLGGDLVSGTIHDELVATNDKPIMPAVLDLYGVLIWLLQSFKQSFDKIEVYGVAGNHGRSTRKPLAKERGPTNFDWLLCKLLEKHFQGDKKIRFTVPDGPDVRFSIYGHKYLLTHGDQFRGGDGVIGPLGPITRGRHRKQTRDTSVGHGFDTMLCGHFHTLMQLPHLIVNGSLKGLDEYAYQLNVAYEPPSQALWITHPDHGITFQMPVYVDDPAPKHLPSSAP